MRRYQHYFIQSGILSPMQIDRMKGAELIAGLLMSINQAGPINRKIALDRSIGNESVNGNTLARLTREFVRTLGLLKKMFPELHVTRFRNLVESYSLFLFIWEMDVERFVLSDKGRNAAAFELLRKLSTGVDELRQQLRRAVPQKPRNGCTLTTCLRFKVRLIAACNVNGGATFYGRCFGPYSIARTNSGCSPPSSDESSGTAAISEIAGFAVSR